MLTSCKVWVLVVVRGGVGAVVVGLGGFANASCGEKETARTERRRKGSLSSAKIPNQIIPASAQLPAPSSRKAPGLDTFGRR